MWAGACPPRACAHTPTMAPSARDAADAFLLAVAESAGQHAQGDALDALAAAARLHGCDTVRMTRGEPRPRCAAPNSAVEARPLKRRWGSFSRQNKVFGISTRTRFRCLLAARWRRVCANLGVLGATAPPQLRPGGITGGLWKAHALAFLGLVAQAAWPPRVR